jgi:Tfp pilus assembly protein PilF
LILRGGAATPGVVPPAADPLQGPDADELLPLAVARPHEALARARAVLAAHPPPFAASIARQTIGIVLRDRGDTAEATGELRTALRLARMACSPAREADVLATLGASLVFGGHTVSGRRVLDRAVELAQAPQRGQILVRRGIAAWVLGDHAAALADLTRAVRELRRSGDVLWEPRALTTRAFVHLALGASERAVGDLERAERLLSGSAQELEVAYAVHNRAIVAIRSGDVPEALTLLDRAGERYAALSATVPDLTVDRCRALLTAGLARTRPRRPTPSSPASTPAALSRPASAPSCCSPRPSAPSTPGAPRRPVSARPPPGGCSRHSGGRGGGRTPNCSSCGHWSTQVPRRTGCSAPRSGAPPSWRV